MWTKTWWVVDGSVVQPVEPTPFAIWVTRNMFRPRLLALEESVLPPKLKLPAAASENMRQALLHKIAAMLSLAGPTTWGSFDIGHADYGWQTCVCP